MKEPPYGDIWDYLRTGKVVPFLGAGASLAGRPKIDKWDGDNPTVLPSGVELAAYLASKANFPSKRREDLEDLAKVASYCADSSGRRRLRERLRAVLDHKYAFSPLHELLASVPVPLLIVVTNYDTLLEQAFRKANNKPYDLVIYPSDRLDAAGSVLWWRHGEPQPSPVHPNKLNIDLSKRTVIYKMHGSIARSPEWDNFVITEEDYIEFLSRMNTAVPPIFYSHCLERNFLFLGYSLRDWNLRVVLRNLSRMLVKRGGEILPSWAIQRNPSDLERDLWEKRNVTIFDVPLDEFTARIKREAKN